MQGQCEPVPRVSKLDKHPRGPSWWRELADDQGGDAFVLAFSGGKDSVAMALALQAEGYDLYPVAYIEVPGLSFIDDTLNYYERTLFNGRRIVRALHPNTANHLMAGEMQPPHRLAVCEAMSFDMTDVDIQQRVVVENKLPEDTMAAVAIRANDNMFRRKIIAVNGPVAVKKNQFYAIWDWGIDRMIEIINKSGLSLASDYLIWPHNFTSHPRFYVMLKEHFPDDWKRLLEWFPLAEAEVFRYERMRPA
jgi:hypothetical protein